MQVRFYATLRFITGHRMVEVDLEPGDTVRRLLFRLADRFPALAKELWDATGSLSHYIHVFVNGREVKYLPDGLDTPLQEQDRLDVFPPVAGGEERPIHPLSK